MPQFAGVGEAAVAVLFLLLYAYQMASVPPTVINTMLGAVSCGPVRGRNTTLECCHEAHQALHGIGEGKRPC